MQTIKWFCFSYYMYMYLCPMLSVWRIKSNVNLISENQKPHWYHICRGETPVEGHVWNVSWDPCFPKELPGLSFWSKFISPSRKNTVICFILIKFACSWINLLHLLTSQWWWTWQIWTALRWHQFGSRLS